MGIFQLIDYVRIDICQHIGAIMNNFLSDELLQDSLIDEMIREDILGGQDLEGLQKNGFFAYEGSSRSGIYSMEKQAYILSAILPPATKRSAPFPRVTPLGNICSMIPSAIKNWQISFHNFNSCHTLGVSLAQAFLAHSRMIANELVDTGVAQSLEDVNTVLQLGFISSLWPQRPWSI